MTPDELTAALAQQSPTRAADQDRLAADVRRALLELPARAMEVTRAPDRELGTKGRALVAALEELGTAALLDVAPATRVDDEVWRLHTAAAAAVSLRARVAAYLMSRLSDRRRVPIPAVFDGLAAPPEGRVCDEAYLALRELDHTGESRGAYTMDRRAFRRLSEEEKDAEIAAVVARLPFSRFVEDAGV